ncbi:MAG: M23 family metallopeptidase [Rubrivivax sp.]|nr:M23 family metallopeptidase [Rubrivivax sp.]
MLRRILAVVGIVGLVGWIGWIVWPSDAAQLEQAAAPALPPAEPPVVAAPEPPALRTETVELRRRDTLAELLRRGGLTLGEAHALATGLREAGADLRRMRAGDRLELSRGADDRIVAVAYAPSAWQRFHATRTEAAWTVKRTDVTPEIGTEIREGEVRNSLWEAVDAGAIEAQTMLELVQIFESSFDFTADPRAGDRFRLLVEARYANGAFVEEGRILAAQYVTEDETLAGVAFEVDGRTAYYDPDGRSLKKMFLRSPLQFTRISSGFTHRRPHPILGGVRPHLAIDYAAPTGTPVWAVADGIVEFAGRKGGNGIQVLLRHRAGYKTYYNHLSRVAAGVRPGVKVAQKRLIGYVGSTGLSTGPHLDYRVSRGGTFVNPLNEKFLPGDPIPNGQRAAFAAHAQSLLERLHAAAAPAAQVPVPGQTGDSPPNGDPGRS